MVLCASSSYEQKYYLNEAFCKLPDVIKEELQIMCVVFTEEVGGELVLQFSDEGRLMLQVAADEGDLLFDEIGSGLKIKQLQIQKEELFSQLEKFYQMFVVKE